MLALPPDDRDEWQALLRDYAELLEPAQGRDAGWRPAAACRFEVRIRDVPLWFEVELPRGYPEHDAPAVYVRGDAIDRAEQERWQTIVRDKMDELKAEETEYVTYVHFQMEFLIIIQISSPKPLLTNSSPSPPPRRLKAKIPPNPRSQSRIHSTSCRRAYIPCAPHFSPPPRALQAAQPPKMVRRAVPRRLRQARPPRLHLRRGRARGCRRLRRAREGAPVARPARAFRRAARAGQLRAPRGRPARGCALDGAREGRRGRRVYARRRPRGICHGDGPRECRLRPDDLRSRLIFINLATVR